jgi:[acyl-carrier-protein] S-malonyltransferase
MAMKAVIFPGQGAQYVGMGRDLYDNYSEAKDIFLKVDGILDFELSQKCFFGPSEELRETYIQQLAILSVSLATFEVFKRKDIKIDYLSGLSLGEYSCLYVGEVLSLPDVVNLVKERGLAMQKASITHPSTMLAVIGVERDTLKSISGKEGFYIANFNSPNQTVISLRKEDKERVKEVLESEGAKVVELDVSGGFHSPFMEEAREQLSKVTESLEFKDAKIPIVSNVTALPHIDREEIRKNLIQQLTSPVLWEDSIKHMVDKGVDTFFEIGPSAILKGLIKKIVKDVKVINIERGVDEI